MTHIWTLRNNFSSVPNIFGSGTTLPHGSSPWPAIPAASSLSTFLSWVLKWSHVPLMPRDTGQAHLEVPFTKLEREEAAPGPPPWKEG